MKKVLISITMIITILLNTMPAFAVSEQSDYPESPHNYSSNSMDEWNYSYSADADYLCVTFSQDTYFGPGGEDYYDEENGEYLCDYLIIASDMNYSDEKLYFADELAGKTILIPNNNFSILLVTDGSKNYYGFKITDISNQGEFGDSVFVKYMADGKVVERDFYTLDEDGGFPISADLKNRIIGDKSIIGWQDSNGHKYLYKYRMMYFIYDSERTEYTNAFDVKPGDELVLTPIYTPVSITPEETFSFENSKINFRRGYDMTSVHAKQLKNCYKSATKNNEFKVLGAVIGFLVKTIYQIFPWGGSCCGFPIAILMQHYGMIDLLSENDASTVRALAPDKNVTSALNFYNAVTPAAVACANKAQSGTEEYKTQVKKLFETVSAGNPAVCFIHCGYVNDISYESPHSIVKGILSQGIRKIKDSFVSTHCILLTGAYIDGDGNHIFIGYDENDASYCYGEPQIYRVLGDYESVFKINSYDNGPLGSIAWFDDAGFLKSFKADGETDPSAWYSYYCAKKDNNS